MQIKQQKLMIIAIVVLIIFIVGYRVLREHQHKFNHQPQTKVIVTQVKLRDAPLIMKTQGTIEASRSVSIQPQVTGVIKKIGFTPGQSVTAGQLLFEIDSTTYQAALAKAQANLAKDQAQLQTYQKDEARYQKLLQKGFVSDQQYDQIKSQVDEQMSIIKLDEANIQQTQAELNYTKILAPIAGKTGNVMVKEGDLVNANSTNVLVTVNQLSPIFVNFYLPQSDLPLLMKYQQQQALSVEVYTGNKQQLLDKGTLTFIDNTVNSDSGTVLLKATMPNKNNLLWPGESVIAKLIFTVEKNQLAIPSQAVQVDQAGYFVYLIKNNQVKVKQVKILRQMGEWTYIREGLQAGDEVATVFPPNLQDNAKVIVSTQELTQEKP
ncbi:MAG: efflux RND transporter periplasmic adaptor subunit [Legionellales bacterium]|nr:efflux RND transporter periplasmic adaptor subunit [Legionellales bacterium]